jgi:hypothetical protein
MRNKVNCVKYYGTEGVLTYTFYIVSAVLGLRVTKEKARIGLEGEGKVHVM